MPKSVVKSEPQYDLRQKMIELLSLRAEVGRLAKLNFGSQFPPGALISKHDKFPVLPPHDRQGGTKRRRLVSRNQI